MKVCQMSGSSQTNLQNLQCPRGQKRLDLMKKLEEENYEWAILG